MLSQLVEHLKKLDETDISDDANRADRFTAETERATTQQNVCVSVATATEGGQ